MNSEQLLRLLRSVTVQQLGDRSVAVQAVLSGLQGLCSLQTALETPHGWKQLMPFSDLIAHSPELLDQMDAWLPKADTGPVPTFLPFALLLSLSQMRAQTRTQDQQGSPVAEQQPAAAPTIPGRPPTCTSRESAGDHDTVFSLGSIH